MSSSRAPANLSKEEVEKNLAASKKALDEAGDVLRAMLGMQEDSCPRAVGADGGWPTIAQHIAAERAAIAKSTNLAQCDADPLGDGDQTPLRRALPGTPTQALVDVWCAGTWLGMLLTLPIEGRGADGSPPLPAAAAAEIAPPFSWACARGKFAAVEAALPEEVTAAVAEAEAVREGVTPAVPVEEGPSPFDTEAEGA